MVAAKPKTPPVSASRRPALGTIPIVTKTHSATKPTGVRSPTVEKTQTPTTPQSPAKSTTTTSSSTSSKTATPTTSTKSTVVKSTVVKSTVVKSVVATKPVPPASSSAAKPSTVSAVSAARKPATSNRSSTPASSPRSTTAPKSTMSTTRTPTSPVKTAPKTAATATKAPAAPVTKTTAPKPTTTATRPTAAKPTAAKPVAAKPTAAKPTAAKPTATKPAISATTATKPTATAATPAAKKPATTATKPLTGAAASAAARKTTTSATSATSATARTTTSTRVTPGASAGSAAKPPAVGGRAPPKMTQTSIRTAARPSPVIAAKKEPGTPGTGRSVTATPNQSKAAVGSTAARRPGVTGARGTASSAGTTQPVKTPTTPLELKKAIAHIKTKLDETTTRLQAKESELSAARQQLESGSYLDNYAATDASSDGGETLVPEIDLSKIAAEDKDVVMTAIGAKEKEVARKKHHIRTLKARIERLRQEHDKRVKELLQLETERQATHAAELAILQKKLVEATEKFNDVIVLRKKLDDTRKLHSKTIEELNIIHDDKLQSLGWELQMYQQQSKPGRAGDSGDQVLDNYRRDLESIKNANRKELAQFLKEQQEQVDLIKAQFEGHKKEAVDEHKHELEERLTAELEQIKGSHTSLLSDRVGAESGMTQALEQRHVRTLEELKIMSGKDHQHFLTSSQNKHEAEIARVETKNKEHLAAIEAKIKRLHEKFEADVASIHAKAESLAEERKKAHLNEIAKRNEKHSGDMVSCATTTRDKIERELVAVNARFSSFVADIQGNQDAAMHSLQTGYETRIAELIVNHENRVQELENEANEQVEHELERVENEFEADRERMNQEQTKKVAELNAAHQETMERLEDQLTKAEEQARQSSSETMTLKQVHQGTLNEIHADLQAQLNAVNISIEALVSAHQRDGKAGMEALQAGHHATLSTEKSTHESNLGEALAKKDKAWTVKNDYTFREIQVMRDRLRQAQDERDKARATLTATEERLKEELAGAASGLYKDHTSRMEHSQETVHSRLERVTKTHEEHAEVHEAKLADLVMTHHQQLETLNDEHKALMKAREQEQKTRLLFLQKAIELAQLKKQNKALKEEQVELEQVVEQLQVSHV